MALMIRMFRCKSFKKLFLYTFGPTMTILGLFCEGKMKSFYVHKKWEKPATIIISSVTPSFNLAVLQ